MPRVAGGGESFVALVEFSTPLRVKVMLAPGNSTQPGSPHTSDQLQFLAEKKLRTP
jgi:acyl-homoserine-lactone acylase